MTFRRWLPQEIAFLSLLVADPALGAWSLLQNGTFDTGSAPWTTVVGAAGFDSTTGNPPGSLHLLAGLGLSCSAAASECLNVSNPAAFDLSADNLAIDYSANLNHNELRLLAYQGLDCTSTETDVPGPGTGPQPTIGVWEPLDGIVFIPPGTKSLRVETLLCIEYTSGAGVNFDNVGLRPAYYVFNPHFALPIGIKPWIGPTLVLDATRDAGGDPSSGSAQVTSTSTASCSTASQCILARPGPLDLEAKILLPGSNTATGQAEAQYVFTADSSCDPATTLGTEILGPVSGPPDTWSALSQTGVAAPSGTQAVLVELTACATSAGTFAANFDDGLADPRSVAAIPTLSGWGLAALGALLLGTALHALGRMARRRPRG